MEIIVHLSRRALMRSDTDVRPEGLSENLHSLYFPFLTWFEIFCATLLSNWNSLCMLTQEENKIRWNPLFTTVTACCHDPNINVCTDNTPKDVLIIIICSNKLLVLISILVCPMLACMIVSQTSISRCNDCQSGQ